MKNEHRKVGAIIGVGAFIGILILFYFSNPDSYAQQWLKRIVNFSASPWEYISLALIIFIVIREFLTWYWKQTKIVSLLEKIEKNTRK